MPRIDLIVPFNEKDEAKRLGARWDPKSKVWFVPDGLSPEPFRHWIPKIPEVNYRSSSYFVAKCPEECWSCGAPTWVYGIALPSGHEQLDVDEDAAADDPDALSWQSMSTPAFLHYVDYLPKTVQESVKALTQNFRLDFSKTTQSSYWMNHCEHCGVKLGDFQLFCEPEGPFMPMNESEASVVRLQRVSASFEAHAEGYTYDPNFFYCMKQE